MRSIFALRLAGLIAFSPLCLLAAENSATKSTDAFIGQITDHFSVWDQDKNGKLSSNELDAVALNEKTLGSEAAAVAALKRASNKTKVPAPELTLENIIKLSKTPPPPTDGPNFPKMYAEGLSRITKANRTVFAEGSPRLSGIHQGKMGDCFCLAPLGAMLNRDPKQVSEMFQILPENKCRVAFGKKSVVINMPTDAELAMLSSTRQDGLWVNLYEKAIAVTRNDAKPEKERVALPIDTLANGGSAGTMLSIITGHQITRASCKYFKDDKYSADEKASKLKEMRSKLTSAVAEKRLMTCGTTVTTVPDLTPNHAYAVLNYDEKADALQLWNPHGNTFTPKGAPGLTTGYATKEGIFTIPLSEFVQMFSGLAFEGT